MTAPNKNEGLIARLTAEAIDPFAPGLRHVSYVNPDGPEAARAIQDLEEEVGRLIAERDRAQHFLRLRDRQITTLRKFWLRDAEEALAGDLRALRNRVEMAKADPVEVVLSEEPLASTADG